MDLYRLARPYLLRLDPERAHRLGALALGAGLAPSGVADPAVLGSRLAGIALPNPIGLAAGFDKDARVFGALLRLGFGFVEVGTLTPRPQPGNARPRVFRLVRDAGVINRLGFNNGGQPAAAVRLARRRAGVVGINIGANADSADRIADYVAGVAAMAPLADYLTVNISSPNTTGLRALQSRSALDELLARIGEARCGRPLFVKIAPDLDAAELEAVAEVTLARGVDGIIATNTTLARPATLRDAAAAEAGGLSGAPLFARSTEVLRALRRLTRGRLALIGVGGVASGADAYVKIRAGADAVQLYTALVYDGPGLVGRIKRDLAALLVRDGFARVADAVGVDA